MKMCFQLISTNLPIKVKTVEQTFIKLIIIYKWYCHSFNNETNQVLFFFRFILHYCFSNFNKNELDWIDLKKS